MPVKPEILKQELITHSRLFYVEQLDLRFSNGVERSYERLITGEHRAVMVVPMLDDDTVLMIREYSAGFHDYQLTLPKGAVHAGEPLQEAANRELMEEVGYGARDWQPLKSMSLSPGYMQHSIDVFIARDLYEQRLPGDEPEPLEVVPVKLSELPEVVAKPEFTEARAIAALFLAREWLLREG